MRKRLPRKYRELVTFYKEVITSNGSVRVRMSAAERLGEIYGRQESLELVRIRLRARKEAREHPPESPDAPAADSVAGTTAQDNEDERTAAVFAKILHPEAGVIA